MKKSGRNMGKTFGVMLLSTTLLAGSLGTMAYGATTVRAQLSPDITIMVDGAEKTFYTVEGQEAHPIIYDGTTYLPLRAIGELMGKNVNWDASSYTVSLSGTRGTSAVTGTPDTRAKQQNITVQLRPEFTITVDGVTQHFTDSRGNEIYPMLYDGSTYLPLRAIGELMGKEVSWDNDTDTVILRSDTLVTDADSFHQNTNSSTNTTRQPSNHLLTEEEAKAEALSHAGLNKNQVSFIRQHLEWDDGRQVYDIEFYTDDGKGYDYEIDARTGNIISYDFDAEYYNGRTNNNGTRTDIGEAKVRSIAVNQVSGATASNIVKLERDYDDGRLTYEVKLIVGTTEYELEIDAYTGNVLSRDSESIYD